jgi:hypothetical protein
MPHCRAQYGQCVSVGDVGDVGDVGEAGEAGDVGEYGEGAAGGCACMRASVARAGYGRRPPA